MHTAQSRQKSYADVRRKDLEFEIGDKVFLKVAPMKGVLRFERRGKLSPRFVGPFEILERIGPVAYRLALPPSLSTVHDVFHVSMLRKYVPDPSHVVDYEPLEIDENLSYVEQPVEILAREVKTLRNKEIPLVKVLWRNHRIEEATWEREDVMRSRYPELVWDQGKSNGKVVVKTSKVDAFPASRPRSKTKEPKPPKEGDCYYCKKIRHWKRNCPLYLKELKKNKGSVPSISGIFVIEVNLSTSNPTS
ncbi:pol protein [Cucumis melo var. makuwa]|uniref:Pol protein n=1 Tax=Cucumis melo var. makuwa TaxID=1194695 RepID=A0A5D3BAK6_CUCMM|nr:pol protein [Cucumis melo var. makuwa]